MRSDIEKWFASKQLPLDKILDIGRDRHGLTKEAIQMAIESVYEDRDQVPQIKMAWEIWKKAKMYQSTGKSNQYVDRWEEMAHRLDEVSGKLTEANQTLDDAKKRFKKDRVIYWSIIVLLFLITVAMGVSDGRWTF